MPKEEPSVKVSDRIIEQIKQLQELQQEHGEPIEEGEAILWKALSVYRSTVEMFLNSEVADMRDPRDSLRNSLMQMQRGEGRPAREVLRELRELRETEDE